MSRGRHRCHPQGVAFEVVPPTFPETLSRAAWPRPQDYARETAAGKAREVAARVAQEDAETPTLVIGADTVVAVEGRILEKPKDREDAVAMLRRLSGKQHSVITGVALVTWGGAAGPAQEVTAFHEETRVTFSPLSEALIREYVDGGEGRDKAGAYAIQGRGAMLVEGVAGDVLAAVGFPLNRFCRELARALPGAPGSDVTAPAAGAQEEVTSPATGSDDLDGRK
ncbi:probable bifunctional dTTP/UTP pyrophosphatase/methyltransferase protein [Mus pahari]|uniref:probable bifunctional dTTP/UTP pyrophosphatase/methyltransferase protein n=1 Tax=Mus pahari TaxID=10093 RepID=UPI001114DADD|nr:probable bifunctional dTTP/UTP pyrophosphatase/methyltransferase protein [Mus pahari]